MKIASQLRSLVWLSWISTRLVEAGFVKPSCILATRASCRVVPTGAWLPPWTRRSEQRCPPSLCGESWKLNMSIKRDDDGDEPSTTTFPFESSSTSTTALLAATLLLGSVLIHASGWAHFFASLSEMKTNSSPEDFSSAFNFWLFGAISHPILSPIFAVSEVLHASPGPRLAGLVPISFLLGSGAIVWILIAYKQLQILAVTAVTAGLIGSIGAGLDGQTAALLGDYNIQLDDDYKGKVVKGCPAPETVRSSTVSSSFDYQKYKGLWYWQKVHDWTQFREMYDTSLDIRLTDNGYVNTLTIKGPSPSNSPLSWDKSPLMDGVRYSWVGTIDSNSPPGVSNESGFGVSFPNYIVDVQTNDNGEYQELIQFQCIEVGGVRLYEGVDFMSRSPTMSETEHQAMHQRAHQAGLDAYGSSPEQMHRIERAKSRNGDEINEWQKMWNRLGVERYLDQSLR